MLIVYMYRVFNTLIFFTMQLIKLRDQVAKSGTYSTVSLILFVILIVSIGVTINRHWELKSALERNFNLTSTVETLREHRGKCGTEQITELKNCREKLQELIKIEGKCIVFEDNLKGNNSLALATRTEDLRKDVEDFKNRAAKDAERRDKCDEHLQHVQEELYEIVNNVTVLILEKEDFRMKYKTCSDKLSATQKNVD